MRLKKFLHISISLLLTAWFLYLGYALYLNSYLRLEEAFIDLFQSLKFYFFTLFDKPVDSLPSVVEYSSVFRTGSTMPATAERFKSRTSLFFDTLFSKDNFISWLYDLGAKTSNASKIIMLILPCVFIIILIIKRIYESTNNNYNEDTKPLRLYKKIAAKTYQPIKRFTLDYLSFLKEHSGVWHWWIIIWALHLNLVSIVVGFLAYYFFFAVTIRLDTVYLQVVKLTLDFKPFLNFCPWWAYVLLGMYVFAKIRKKIAIGRLRHFENRNCGFIKDLPIVSMTCGSMGKRKTTMITDMTLSQEIMFREKAFDILQKADMKFSYFPWIMFEIELMKCIEHKKVYNLATAKAWVQKKRERYERHKNNDWQLYGYDSNRYGLTYDDNLKEIYLFDVLETYAQAYFIYILESSLIVSNYSIRTDNLLFSEGNFPMWSMDFFADKRRKSRHAHILDFDVLRLGKKVMESNPYAGSFEFGVVAITEIGKERGNTLELKELKKRNDETNQKNDLFNSWLKMCRHSATVDNYPFIKVFTDEQRPESWGADARDLCDIVNIESAGPLKIALPFYTIEDMITEWAFNKFISLYYDFRYRRGDNTLLVYLLKMITARLWKYNARIYNKYGYSILQLETERGTMDGKFENKVYYLMNQKIYSRRFTTDCFSDYFNDIAKKTPYGLKDYLEYVTEKASVEELKSQNSYFINTLYKDIEESSAESDE